MNNPLHVFHYNRGMRKILEGKSYELLQCCWTCVLEAEQESQDIFDSVSVRNSINDAKQLHRCLHYIPGYCGNSPMCLRPSADKICKWLWSSNNEFCRSMFTVVWGMSKRQPRYRFNEKAYQYFAASYIAWLSEQLSETGLVTVYDIERQVTQLLQELQSKEYIDDTLCY